MERNLGFAALEPPLGEEARRWALGEDGGKPGGQRYPDDRGDHDGAKNGGTVLTEGWKVGVKAG